MTSPYTSANRPVASFSVNVFTQVMVSSLYLFFLRVPNFREHLLGVQSAQEACRENSEASWGGDGKGGGSRHEQESMGVTTWSCVVKTLPGGYLFPKSYC